MPKRSLIELYKESMKFSVAHFTIFSATERERIHGHNYQVYLSLEVLVYEDGLSFDYRYYKDEMNKLCAEIDEYVLLAGASRYLTIEHEGDYVYAHFAHEKIPFLQRDVVILPIENITVEALSAWFVDRLTQNKQTLNQHHIEALTVKISSAPGQTGSTQWRIGND